MIGDMSIILSLERSGRILLLILYGQTSMNTTSHAKVRTILCKAGWTLLAVVLLTAGCSSSQRYFVQHPPGNRPLYAAPRPAVSRLHDMPMFSGHTGAALAFSDLLRAISWADVVIIGEQHDQSRHHAFELTLLRAAIGDDTHLAVTLEMLSRDQQTLLDDFLLDVIDTEQFVKALYKDNTQAADTWMKARQPLLELARMSSTPVYAANAPDLLVDLVCFQGWPAMETLSPAERFLVAAPPTTDLPDYHQRFVDAMRHHPPLDDTSDAGNDLTGHPSNTDTADSDTATTPAVLPDDEIQAMYRGQLLRDATMAYTIAEVRKHMANKVLHIGGQFHSDFDGALYTFLRSRNPELKILTVSLQNTYARRLHADDNNCADVVVYTAPPAQ